jgi:hypothetical protein
MEASVLGHFTAQMFALAEDAGGMLTAGGRGWGSAWWKELRNRPPMITEVIRTAIALGVIGASKGLRRRR